MSKKKFKDNDGTVQIKLIKDPDEVEALEKKLDVEDNDLAELTKARKYDGKPRKDRNFQVDADVYVLVKKKSIKLVVNFKLKNGKVVPDPEMTEKELSHWIYLMRKSLFVLAHDSVDDS